MKNEKKKLFHIAEKKKCVGKQAVFAGDIFNLNFLSSSVKCARTAAKAPACKTIPLKL